VNAFDHRRFLNQFFVNRFPGSFARGVPFQDNPATGDCRISGTCASLCGLEQGDALAVARILLLHGVTLSTPGIPLLYLGDEVGTLNDHGYARDPAKAGDSRWVHRPARDAARYAQRHDPATPAGRIHAGFRRLVAVRQSLPCFADPGLTAFDTGNVHVLGYLRGVGAGAVLVLANFSDSGQRIEPAVLAGAVPHSLDHLSGQAVDLRQGLALPPCGLLWLAFNLSGKPKASR